MTFIAIVPPFVNPNTAVAPQMVWLAAGSLIPEMLVLFACGAIAARLGFLLQSPTVLRRIERACAVLLASVAAMIVFYA